MNFYIKKFSLIQILLTIGLIAVCKSSPLKVSKPKALVPTNLRDVEIKNLIETNPSQIQQQSQLNTDALPYPPIQLYLTAPDPNKGQSDFLFPSNYPTQTTARELPTKLTLTLDPLQAPNHKYTGESVAPAVEKLENTKKQKSVESYDNYYFPVHVALDDRKYEDKELALMELKPPASTADVGNYYVAKPKKIPKKYQPSKKNAYKPTSTQEGIIPTELFPPLEFNSDRLVPIDNDGLVLPDEQIFVTAQPVERFAPKPIYRSLTVDDLNTGEYIPNREHTKEPQTEAFNRAAEATVSSVPAVAVAAASTKVETRADPGDNTHNSYSDDNDRVEFQMHGFNGPESYKFGFDTGKGENRQFRVEYRNQDGDVKGHYGWCDENGKLHLTKYSSTAKDGFKSQDIENL